VDPKWLIKKVATQKGHNYKSNAMIGWIGVVSHHLQSLLDVIELTILCASVCKVGYVDAHIRETLL